MDRTALAVGVDSDSTAHAPDQKGEKMTDLEMTRLCAEAMGLEIGPDWNQGYVMLGGYNGIVPSRYDPLQIDAQAFALVRKLGMSIGRYADDQWNAWMPMYPAQSEGLDLNRCIVECAAMLQAAKE